MIKVSEPAWMREMDGEHIVKEGEVLNAFGIHPNSCVNRLILNKDIPAPTERIKRGKYKPDEREWKVKDLREVFNK